MASLANGEGTRMGSQDSPSAISFPSSGSHPYTQVPDFMARHLRNIKEGEVAQTSLWMSG